MSPDPKRDPRALAIGGHGPLADSSVSHGLVCTTIVMCECGSPKPFTVRAVTEHDQSINKCPACGTRHVITKIEYSNVQGLISQHVEISTVGGKVVKPMGGMRQELPSMGGH